MPPVKKALTIQELWDAAPSASELPDDWEDKQAEAEASEPKKSASSKLWDAAADATEIASSAVLNGTENAARSVAGFFTDGIPNTIDFLGEAAERAPEVQDRLGIPKKYQINEPPGSPAWVGQQAIEAVLGAGDVLHDKLAKLPEDERNAVLTRVGTTAALTLASGPGAGVLRQAVMASLGGMLGGEISKEAGFEAATPLFTKAQATKEGASFVENLLIPGFMKGAGKVLSKTGEVTKSASVPIGAKRLAEQTKPGYLTGRFTLGKNVGGEMAMVEQLKEGEKTLAKTIKNEFPEKIQDVGEFDAALNDSIKSRKTEKASLLNRLETALSATPGVRPFSRRDSGYAKITQTIRRLKKSGVGADMVSDLEDIQKKLTDAFTTPLAQGQTGVRLASKGIRGMADVLDESYEKLRGLRAFDDDMLAAAGKNPSQIAGHKKAIAAYKDVAKSIRESIVAKARELENAGSIRRGSAARLGELNDELHDLIPFQEASRRFGYSDYQLRKQAQPAGTLLTDPMSPGAGGGSVMSKARDIITGPVTRYPVERARLNQSLGFASDTFDDMRSAADMMLGSKPVPNTNPQGLSGRVIGPAEQAAGDALQATVQSGALPVAQAAQQPAIATLASSPEASTTSALGAIVNDPLSMQMIENDPDIKPETVTMLRQALNGTAYEKQKALGQFKIEARDKGWFPPSPMQGIHSFIELPNSTYHGEKVKGTITDQAEGMIFLDAVNEIPDISRRASLKSAFNSPGHYVLEFPDALRAEVKKAAAPIPKEPEQDLEPGGESSVATSSLDEGSGAMDRVVHPY